MQTSNGNNFFFGCGLEVQMKDESSFEVAHELINGRKIFISGWRFLF